METHRIIVGPYQVNCWLLQQDDRVLVTDPGLDAQAILAKLEKAELTPAAYLLTHGHADHIGALPELLRRFPAPVYMHPADERWAFTSANQIPPFYPPLARPAAPFRAARQGRLDLPGGFACEVIETPGHTAGGVCYYFAEDGLLLSGDTLFQGNVGRTDLPGGNEEKLRQSLRALAKLPPATQVLPGHGDISTIADEEETCRRFG